MGPILIDINKEWITSRRYLSDGGEISSAYTGSEIIALGLTRLSEPGKVVTPDIRFQEKKLP